MSAQNVNMPLLGELAVNPTLLAVGVGVLAANFDERTLLRPDAVGFSITLFCRGDPNTTVHVGPENTDAATFPTKALAMLEPNQSITLNFARGAFADFSGLFVRGSDASNSVVMTVYALMHPFNQLKLQ